MAVIECNGEKFESVVLKSEKPVLVDFNATWCGPCRMMAPVLEELSNENDKFDFVAIDVDEEQDLAAEYGVMSIPCLVVFKDGKEVIRNVGFISKEELESMLGDI
jgi:thioredoxin 1